MAPAARPTSAAPSRPARHDPDLYDLVSWYGEASDSGEVSSRLLTLRAALPEPVERAAIDGFLSALVHEEPERISLFTTADATMISPGRVASSLVDYWRARVRGQGYSELPLQRLYRAGEVESYGPRDPLPSGRSDLAATLPMAPGDRLVRVLMESKRVKGGRVFGDELWFWLRRSGNQYRIRAVSEDFSQP